MKIIALEEHFNTPAVRDAWARQADDDGQSDMMKLFDAEAKLEDLGAERLRQMDACGVDVQVLSLTTPGVQNLTPGEAVPLARQANDFLAATIRAKPDRFQGFATLPTPAPDEAARELQRAVSELGMPGAMLCGRTRERNLDHPDFLPIFEAAAGLRVPLYIHPQVPQRAIREIYYSGFDEKIDTFFANGGIGWHYETGIQFIRLVLAGVFDRFPDLQIILGHWGESVLFYLNRVDAMSKVAKKLEHRVADYFRQNLYVTPSGIFTQEYLRRSVDILGIDRILFSTDYPFLVEPDGGARAFLDKAALSEADRQKIAYGNWERLIQSSTAAAVSGDRPGTGDAAV